MKSKRSFLRKTVLGISAMLLLVAATTAAAVDITGAGSTFIYPVLSKWSSTYHARTGNKVNYQSIGSGGGIAQIKAATVTFGASDKPLSSGELKQAGLVQFPVVIGGVVPVVNVPGVRPGKMKLTGRLLAKIYLGKIKKWNSRAITRINPGLKLPDTRITVVHRSDGSGTTFNWVNYLSKVSRVWRARVGEGTSVKWPTGIGGKGNEGVAAYVKRIKGSIGYVELSYAKQNKMSYTAVKNKAGRFIEPTAQSFQAAAARADWSRKPDFYQVITNARGKKSWPIAATTFVIMYKHPKNVKQSREALSFFKWALEHGKHDALALDYVPLPSLLVRKIEAYWAKKIK